jgi:hypothetical protein
MLPFLWELETVELQQLLPLAVQPVVQEQVPWRLP